jgi:uncharacterized protein (DUF3084 family)
MTTSAKLAQLKVLNTEQEGQQKDFDPRIKRIQEILVDEKFEQLERKIDQISTKTGGSAGHLVQLVDNLSKELLSLKANFKSGLNEERKSRFSENEEIRNAIHKIRKGADKGYDQQVENSAAFVNLREQLKNIVQELAKLKAQKNEINNSQSAEFKKLLELHRVEMAKEIEHNLGTVENISQNIMAITKRLEREQEEFKNTVQQRVGSIDETVKELDIDEHKQRLDRLENNYRQFKDIGAEEFNKQLHDQESRIFGRFNQVENRLIERQDQLEDGVGQLVEEMAQKVAKRFKADEQMQEQLGEKVES